MIEDIRDHFTCWGDQGKDQFPWQGQEVHDVVSAGRHLLLSLLALLAFFLVVIYREEIVALVITYYNFQILGLSYKDFSRSTVVCINIYIWIEKFTTVKVISMFSNFFTKSAV